MQVYDNCRHPADGATAEELIRTADTPMCEHKLLEGNLRS